MSAGYVVDLGNSAISLESNNNLIFSASGTNVGKTCDLLQANTFTNLYVAGISQYPSGQLQIRVQTSDTDVSGDFTDPTSGLAAFPTVFQSGGIVFLNSGGGTTAAAPAASFQQGGVFGAFTSGQGIFSGIIAFAGFQRPHRFVRTLVLSGGFMQFTGSIGFVAQAKTTGSGGGVTFQPTSGVVNV